MDKNSVIGLSLIFVILAVFFWINQPTKEQREQNQRYYDSISLVQKQRDSINAAANINMSKNNMTNVVDSANAHAMADMLGVFATAANGEESFTTIKTKKLQITFSTLGGKISAVTLPEFQTYDSLPLNLLTKNSGTFNLSFFSNNRLINTENLYFIPSVKEKDTVFVDENSEGYDFAMRLYPATADSVTESNSYLELAYHVPADDYMIDVAVNMVNMGKYVYSNNRFIDLNWSMDLLQQEKMKENRYNNTALYYQYAGDDANNLSDTKDDEEDLSMKIKWISYKQQFFTTSLIAKNDENTFVNGAVSSIKNADKEKVDSKYVKTMSSQLSIPYMGDGDESFEMSMYYGPTKFKELNKYHLGLDAQVNIGKFFLIRWINRGILFVFDFLQRFISNYGIIILVLTIILKLVLTPITYKSYLGNAKRKALMPEIKALNEKYPDQEDAMKKQQATMEVYRKFGISPMSGCLPVLLQFPILIAMFRFFPISFELRQQPFLWAKDLSTYDSILDLPFNIPFYGDHVSLFTLLMTASTIIYSIINNRTMGQEGQPGMKFMTYAMPILFLGIFNSYSAGLSYYYLLFNLLSFLQTFIIEKIKPTEKLRAELLLNASKANTNQTRAKKSRWQLKLEELQKIQREQARENAKRRR